MTVTMPRQRYYDGAAIGASVLCLIHCLLLPVLIILLPALAAFLTVPEAFHLWALVFAAPASALTLGTAYGLHRSVKPALIVFPGVVLLALGALVALSESMETALTVVGALLLAIGHALNWHGLRQSGVRATGEVAA